jgi:hypothetical protein
MFARPPFSITAIGLGTCLFCFFAAVAPINEWWTVPFPVATATYYLERSEYLDISGCSYGPFEDWHIVRNDSGAVGLFTGVLSRAFTPEGRLHALVGLRSINESLYVDAADAVARSGLPDTVTVVLDYKTGLKIPLLALLDSAGEDLVRTYEDTVPRPDC